MTKTTHEEDVNRLKEIDEEIKKLKAERDSIRDSIKLDYINGQLARVMGKWVMIPGFNQLEEDHGFKCFRLARVSEVVDWLGENSYVLKMSSLVYIGHSDKADRFNYISQSVMFPTMEDRCEHKIGDLSLVKVISTKKATKIIVDALCAISRRMSSVQKDILKDYADKKRSK